MKFDRKQQQTIDGDARSRPGGDLYDLGKERYRKPPGFVTGFHGEYY